MEFAQRFIMLSKDIEEEYNYYLEYLNETHCILKNILKILDEKISNSHPHSDKLRELESNIFYLADFECKIKELLNNSILVQTREEKLNKTKHSILIFPKYQDEDIFVDLNHSIADIWNYF